MKFEVHHYHHISDRSIDRLKGLMEQSLFRLEDTLDRSIRALQDLSACHRPCGQRDNRPVNGTLLMSKTLNIGSTSTATVAYQDKAGTDVAVVGIPVWTVDDEAIATLVVGDDGMSAVITAVSAGTSTITVTAEGDPTPGVDTITLTGTLNVVDEASGGTLSFS